MMTQEPEHSNPNAEPSASVIDKIAPLLPDLLYPSESDEPVAWVTCPLTTDELLTVSQLKGWLMLPPAVFVEERPEADFWQPVTTEEDWYGDDEKARTKTFTALKALMESLPDRQFFRVGDTEVELYLLGRLPDKSRAGLTTKVVET